MKIGEEHLLGAEADRTRRDRLLDLDDHLRTVVDRESCMTSSAPAAAYSASENPLPSPAERSNEHLMSRACIFAHAARE